MVGHNINKIVKTTEAQQLLTNTNSKLVYNHKMGRSHDWFSIGSKYTENQIIQYIMENE